MWPPSLPSSAFRWLSYEIKMEKRKKEKIQSQKSAKDQDVITAEVGSISASLFGLAKLLVAWRTGEYGGP